MKNICGRLFMWQDSVLSFRKLDKRKTEPESIFGLCGGKEVGERFCEAPLGWQSAGRQTVVQFRGREIVLFFRANEFKESVCKEWVL